MGSRASQQFYVLLPHRGSHEDTEFIAADPVRQGVATTCRVCSRYLGSIPWRPQRKAEITVLGKRAGDFAFFSSADFILSERAHRAYVRSGLVGLSGFDALHLLTAQALMARLL